MSKTPSQCAECEYLCSIDSFEFSCRHPEGIHRTPVAARSEPPPWCPLREKAEPTTPDSLRVLMRHNGQIHKIMFGDTDISSLVSSAEVDLRSDRSARECHLSIIKFTLEFSDV